MQRSARDSGPGMAAAWRARWRAGAVLLAASAAMAMPAAGLTLLMFGRSGLALATSWFVLAFAVGVFVVWRHAGDAAAFEARCLAFAGNAPSPPPMKPARGMTVVRCPQRRGARPVVRPGAWPGARPDVRPGTAAFAASGRSAQRGRLRAA